MFSPRHRARALGALTTATLFVASLPATALAATESKGGEVTLTPESSKLPGGAALQSLVDGAAAIMLLVCLGALVVAAGMWTVSHHSGNPQQASKGRAGVLIAICAALVITAGPALINFASRLGSTVK